MGNIKKYKLGIISSKKYQKISFSYEFDLNSKKNSMINIIFLYRETIGIDFAPAPTCLSQADFADSAPRDRNSE